MHGPSYSKVAGGSIHPARFVVLSTTDDKVLEASTTSVPFYGVSGRGTRRPPLVGLDDVFHAVATETCLVYGPGDKDCVIELGGTVTAGDRLTATMGGTAITTTTTGQFIGAVAMEAGVTGDLIRVQPLDSYEY